MAATTSTHRCGPGNMFRDCCIQTGHNLNIRRSFVEFSSISPEDFEFLASEDNGTLTSAKLRYNFLTKRLTIKMPQLGPEALTGFFTAMVDTLFFCRGRQHMCSAPAWTYFSDVQQHEETEARCSPCSRNSVYKMISRVTSTCSSIELPSQPLTNR
jgi:hypothetical protein